MSNSGTVLREIFERRAHAIMGLIDGRDLFGFDV
jgi:hypothetical protein